MNNRALGVKYTRCENVHALALYIDLIIIIINKMFCAFIINNVLSILKIICIMSQLNLKSGKTMLYVIIYVLTM